MKHLFFTFLSPSLIIFLFATAFSNIAIAAESKISFDTLVAKAIDSNENVKIEESKFRALSFEKQAAIGAFLPQVKAKVYHSATDQLTGFTQNSEGAALESSVNLFRFGGDSYTLSKVNAEIKAQQNAINKSRLSAEMTIAKSLLDYISSQLKFQVSQKTLASKKEYYEIAKHRYTMGLLSAQDLDKVMIDLNNADSNQHDLEIEIEKNKADLKTQLSEVSFENISLQWPWTDRLNSLNSKPNLKMTNENSNEFSVENHPEWRQQNEILNSVTAAVLVKQADLFPRIDLTLSTEKFHYIDQDWTHQWSGIVALEIPLFNRMSDYSSYKVSREQKIQDSIKLELLSRNLKENFELSNRTLKTTIQSALAREKTQKIAEKLYSDNLVRFKTGRATVNDLLLDQERLTQTQYLAIQGWLEAHTSLLKYCQAQGFEQAHCFKN